MARTLKMLTVGGAILALTGQSLAQQDIVEDIIERNRPRIEVRFPGSYDNGYSCQTHNRYCNHGPYDDRGYNDGGRDRDRDYYYDGDRGYYGDDRGREDRKRWEEQEREDRKRWEEQHRENRKRQQERQREDRKRWEEQQREQQQQNRERQQEQWER